MSTNIVVIGCGFAGVWSALSAKRLINLNKKSDQVRVTVIAPEPALVIRPRLYEANAAHMSHPLGPLFEAAGVHFTQGTAKSICLEEKTVQVTSDSGDSSTVSYHRLVLAAGSALVRPQGIEGLREHAFDIDTIDAAAKLESHLENLASLPESVARNTIVICGAGFTGIELATELPKRLTKLPNARIIMVDSSTEVGSTLGPGPRPVIQNALDELKIEVKLGSAVSSVDADGIMLKSGERIDSKTIVWTAGIKASPLTEQFPGDKDNLARIHVDKYLRALSSENVFVTGDAAFALADSKGHYALQSCQHALQLGRVSGHNAAADILQEPMVEYSQEAYNCCLDLGAWGTVISGGWDRKVRLTGDLAKKVKYYINQQLIYPPANAQEAIAAANPIGPDSDELFTNMLEIVSQS